MNEVVRAFIAVEIDSAVREALGGAQDILRQADARVGWVAPRNIHCTLAFLGDIFSGQIGPAGEALKRAAGRAAPFSLDVNGLGFFGSPHSPRVIWAGIGGDATPLCKLQGDLSVELAAAGLQPDAKPFKPHLTIGRVRSSRNAPTLVRLLEEHKSKRFGALTVTRIVLMQSVLNAGGPEYKLIAAADFGGR